jgi:cold shock protein
MARGTVKWFNPTKGYGFIQPQGGGGRDVFVHISAVERAGLSTLNEGQTVEYEIEEEPRENVCGESQGQVDQPPLSGPGGMLV